GADGAGRGGGANGPVRGTRTGPRKPTAPAGRAATASLATVDPRRSRKRKPPPGSARKSEPQASGRAPSRIAAVPASVAPAASGVTTRRTQSRRRERSRSAQVSTPHPASSAQQKLVATSALTG